MFDWEDMRAFAALARTGTLSGAARALRVNHVTIGRRIAALEKALGVPLVERHPRKTVLTERGTSIAAFVSEMEEAALAVWQESQQDAASISGEVTISAIPSLVSGFLVPRLTGFCNAHPRLNLTLSALPGTPLLDRVEADLMIRLTLPDQPGSQVQRLGSMTFSLYAAPHIASSPPDGWTFISFDSLGDSAPQQRWLADYAGHRPIRIRTSDLNGQRAAAASGLGVALLPHFLGEGTPGIVRVDEDIVIPRRNVWLASEHDLRRSPAVRSVAEELARIFLSSPHFDTDRVARS